MNSKQKRTLAAIFERPERTNIRWADIVSLLRALGAEVEAGRAGSRVWVELNGQEAVFHAPHPRPCAHRALVRSLRHFLEKAGVKP